MGIAETKILVVDDEPSICEGIDAILTRAGYSVTKAFSGEEALEIATQKSFDVVLMDLIMPGMDGAETCAQIKQLHPKACVVAISGSPSDDRMNRFLENGGVQVALYKPFGKEDLLAGLNRALQLLVTSR